MAVRAEPLMVPVPLAASIAVISVAVAVPERVLTMLPKLLKPSPLAA